MCASVFRSSVILHLSDDFWNGKKNLFRKIIVYLISFLLLEQTRTTHWKRSNYLERCVMRILLASEIVLWRGPNEFVY